MLPLRSRRAHSQVSAGTTAGPLSGFGGPTNLFPEIAISMYLRYNSIVVGAGHAGCEAALAAARMGMETVMFSINLAAIAMMPCNPSIGGTGKGHLVREIDALGGEMGVNIDKTFIQSRMLNTAKGPAVHSLRAQADKARYHTEMKKTIERTPHLHMRQDEVVEILAEHGHVTGVLTRSHALYRCKAVVLATGTFLKGKMASKTRTIPSMQGAM